MQKQMRLGGIVFVLVFALMPRLAEARAVAGDKTLSLGATGLSFSRETYKLNDSDGNVISDVAKGTTMHLGVGGSGGYLLSDMIELGVNLGIDYGRSTYEPTGGLESKQSNTGFSGGGYGKIRLGTDPKMAPFAYAGLGLRIDGWNSKATPIASENNSGAAVFQIFLGAGIEYYVAEKYALTAGVSLMRTGEAQDTNTDVDNNLYSTGTTTVGLGLGVSTYF